MKRFLPESGFYPFTYLDLFGTPSDAAFLQVIRRHLHSNLISRQDSDEIHPKFTGDVSQNHMAVWQLNFKLSVWQSFQYFAFNFDYVFLGQVKNLLVKFSAELYSRQKPKLVKAFLSCLLVVNAAGSNVAPVSSRCLRFFFF